MPVTIEKKTKTGRIVKKAYETVAERVKRFRDVCPIQEGWGLKTEIRFPEKDVVVALAQIFAPDGNVVATGTAEEKRNESYINKTSAVENAETSSIGRCLFAAGFGGGEYCSAEELLAALKQQEQVRDTELRLVSGSGDPKSKNNEKPQTTSVRHSELSPKLDGITYHRKNGVVIAQGNTFAVKGLLKSSGFRWNPELKAWAREVKNA